MRHQLAAGRRLGWALAALAVASAAAAQTTSVGLSTVRAQRFGNDNLSGIFTPETDDQFGYSLAVGDFDGDGADDLATGMPYDNGLAASPLEDSGSVVVRYSSVGEGLTTNPSQIYLRQSSSFDAPSADDQHGYALAACDFNADGKDDLAIGVPGEDVSGDENAGTVEVHLGTSGGLPQVADFVFTQNGSGIPGEVEEWDQFGWSLACGDFDADGFDDLAVGILEDFEATLPYICIPSCSLDQEHGMVVVIPGKTGGLDFARATSLHQDTDGMVGDAETIDYFGWALAAGNFDGDGFDDLAIGVPGEDDYQGVVQIVSGSPSGLDPHDNVMWSQSFLGGSSEEDDFFGETLAVGDFDGNGIDDLVIGAPEESFGSTPDVGQVHVVYGFPGGLEPATAEIWTQDNVFGAGSSEVNDKFGAALATGDFDHDGRDDLAVGFPGELQTTFAQGGVGILVGTSEGLSPARHRAIAAGTEGFPGIATEQDTQFGFSLAAGDFDGDGHADLAIGMPDENDAQTAAVDVGSETVLYGSLFADGVENGDTGFWSQTVQPPTSNRVQVTAAAKLGPKASKLGLEVVLTGPTPRQPGPPVFVRVGPEAGFQNETHLAGSFFVDPRALTVSAQPDLNIFQMIAFKDGRGITRLTFDLNRNDAVGGWALIATFLDESTGALTFAGGAGFAALNEPAGTNHRIDFDWTAGDPGALKLWQTTYVDGVPNQAGRVPLFSATLPGMSNASISNVLAGMVTGQDLGTFGSLYLDELSFRR